MARFGDECIFCDIIRGIKPANKVYEDELVVAFWDAKPVRPIHILIVPRDHIPTLNDVHSENTILAHIAHVAVTIARQFGVDQSGYRFFVNVNAGGGQVIFHLHGHMIAYKPDTSA